MAPWGCIHQLIHGMKFSKVTVQYDYIKLFSALKQTYRNRRECGMFFVAQKKKP
jgi:hypothetical protein